MNLLGCRAFLVVHMFLAATAEETVTRRTLAQLVAQKKAALEAEKGNVAVKRQIQVYKDLTERLKAATQEVQDAGNAAAKEIVDAAIVTMEMDKDQAVKDFGQTIKQRLDKLTDEVLAASKLTAGKMAAESVKVKLGADYGNIEAALKKLATANKKIKSVQDIYMAQMEEIEIAKIRLDNMANVTDEFQAKVPAKAEEKVNANKDAALDKLLQDVKDPIIANLQAKEGDYQTQVINAQTARDLVEVANATKPLLSKVVKDLVKNLKAVSDSVTKLEGKVPIEKLKLLIEEHIKELKLDETATEAVKAQVLALVQRETTASETYRTNSGALCEKVTNLETQSTTKTQEAKDAVSKLETGKAESKADEGDEEGALKAEVSTFAKKTKNDVEALVEKGEKAGLLGKAHNKSAKAIADEITKNVNDTKTHITDAGNAIEEDGKELLDQSATTLASQDSILKSAQTTLYTVLQLGNRFNTFYEGLLTQVHTEYGTLVNDVEQIKVDLDKKDVASKGVN